jgi:ParB-like chromosome segregation protein Spo0J
MSDAGVLRKPAHIDSTSISQPGVYEHSNRVIVKRRLDELMPHPQQQTYFPVGTVEEIKRFAHTLARGLDHPIEITPDNIIICGHRRVAGAKVLGWEEIDCWVRHDLAEQGESAVELRFLEDNTDRQHLDKLGMARAYQRQRELVEQESRAGRRKNEPQGDLRDEIGRRLGVSGRTLDRYLKILRTPPVVQQAFQRDLLPLLMAENVSHLARSVQDRIAREVEEGGDAKEVVGKYLQEARQRRGLPMNQSVKDTFYKLMERLNRDIDVLTAHCELLPKPSPAVLATMDKTSALFSWLRLQHELPACPVRPRTNVRKPDNCPDARSYSAE